MSLSKVARMIVMVLMWVSWPYHIFTQTPDCYNIIYLFMYKSNLLCVIFGLIKWFLIPEFQQNTCILIHNFLPWLQVSGNGREGLILLVLHRPYITHKGTDVGLFCRQVGLAIVPLVIFLIIHHTDYLYWILSIF